MLSIQTNVNSLIAQQNLSVNNQFQSLTIQQLTSGYRINSAGDDAAGLAVANKFRDDVAELTQGVRNANDGVGQLQIIDGGITNISNILDRLKTLATESASATFTGDRGTLNTEYQNLLGEIDRQATNIKLNTNGAYESNLKVYIGGAASADSNAMVGVDLSGSAVDTQGLKLAGTSVLGGGTGFASNSVNLSDSMASFDVGTAGGANGEQFTISYVDANGTAQRQTVKVDAAANGYSGTAFVNAINSAISSQGISGVTAQIGGDGTLQFIGSSAFTVSHATYGTVSAAAVAAGATQHLTNSSDYNVSLGFTAFAQSGADSVTQYQQEVATVTTGGQDYAVTLTADPTDSAHYAGTIDQAISAINQQLVGSGVTAIKDQAGNISLQSTSSFTIAESATAGTFSGADPSDSAAGALFGASGNVAVTGPTTDASATGNALNAINALSSALATLGLVQGRVGAGENQLNYAINLAQSQITNFDSADSQIRDTDVAAEAANLTKAQVLQQASIAAMAQANSAPQQILTLLRG